MATTYARLSDQFRGVWVPAPAGLLELWSHEAPRTERAFGYFRDGDLAFRFDSGRSVGELLAHVVDSLRLTTHWLGHAHPAPPCAPLHATTISEMSRAVRERRAGLFATLDALSPADFDAFVAPFGVPEPRGVMAFGMLKHEIHHRGELYAMARACGRDVASLYAPMARDDGTC